MKKNETEIKNKFATLFTQINDIGTEYFQGDIGDMKSYFYKFINERKLIHILQLISRKIKNKKFKNKACQTSSYYSSRSILFQCSKCEKILSSKRNLHNHEVKCNGLKINQCELCHKEFSDRVAKYRHKKNKVCERNGTRI